MIVSRNGHQSPCHAVTLQDTGRHRNKWRPNFLGIMNHYEKMQKQSKVFFVCDRKRCKTCSTECKYTTDIDHAAYKEHGPFDIARDGSLWERIRKDGKGIR